ncbi:homoaconitate hydratase [Candidatus Bathyarchaeota archaeon A05DMB-4]|jgi:2-isopropylmalate synthase|nr:homoaconitate hydratase [Candidatus Bathyarchaeota archaeon A05DMB-4]
MPRETLTALLEKLEANGLIANYNRLAKSKPRTLPEKVFIWDETLREGEQTPAVFLTTAEKINLAKVLDEVGVSVIVAGYPAISEEERKTVRRITNQDFTQASLAAPARITRSDVDACLGAGVREIPVFTAFNDLHLKYRLKMSREQVLEKTVDTIEYAKKHGVIVDFVLEDASRTPIEDVIKICATAVKAGAEKVALADTVGFLRPLSMKFLVATVRDELARLTKKKVPLSVHCHNDFGLATANTLAAVEEGVTFPQTCVAGFGERAGNAPLEEVVMALEMLYGVKTGIKTEKLFELARTTEKYFGIPIPVHKPIVGDNAFSHESGIHVHGMLVHPLSYEPIPPILVGRETKFHLGKQTGKHLVEERLKSAGINATPEQIREIVNEIKQMQENRDKGEVQLILHQIKSYMREMRKGITDQDFWNIVRKVTGQKPRLDQR